MSAEVEKDNYKDMFNSMSDTCDMHTEYIAELKKEIIELRGNPPKIEPPPKYKEDLQGEIYQKIFTHGHASLMFETKGNFEGMEELNAAFMVLKNIKPFKPKDDGVYQYSTRQAYLQAQAQGIHALSGIGQQQSMCGLFGSTLGIW